MNDKVAAGIILYNSDYSRLVDCLKSLYMQVDKIILYDNSRIQMEKNKIIYLEKTFKAEYVKSEGNIGMPEALNKITNIVKEEHDWLLTMNPDTIVPENMIQKFKQSFNRKEVAIICPQVVDKRRAYMNIVYNDNKEYVSFCITSAACTRISALLDVGGFDGWLFVDLLDNDLCKRLILRGWKILRDNSVVVDQEFGEIEQKQKWKVNFWLFISKIFHNVNFAKLSYRKKVSNIRLYYTCRNVIYMDKKYENYGGMDYKENYNCNSFMGFVICFILPNVLRADNKIKAIKCAFKGIRDGKQCQVEGWRNN